MCLLTGLGCVMSFVLCFSPDKSSANETLTTLKFAQDSCQAQLGAAKKCNVKNVNVWNCLLLHSVPTQGNCDMLVMTLA